MACEFSVLQNAGEYANGTQLAIDALEIASDLEQRLSAFVDSSDVCRINRQASQSPVFVEEETFQLLALARELYDMTAGSFDITASPLWRLWGFHRRAGRRPAATEIQESLHSVGMNHVELDPERYSVRFQRPGMEINLGGIGKGYAVDRISERLTQEGLKNFVVQAGNSSIRAVGSRAGQATDGWRVNLPHPWKRDENLTCIGLCNRSLGTSGSTHQSFHHRGIRYGHILDPRTGMPAEGLISVTAICATAAQADALATAFYVLGLDGSRRFCDQHPDIDAILVSCEI
jgi:thiamine biosynthesis lipoprotein